MSTAILPPILVVAAATAPAAVHEAALVEAASRGDWVGVHAAEALIALGRPDAALAAFRPRAATTQPMFRVGVWRVLARVEPDAATRDAFVARCRAALIDADGPDRLHALETLAKLAAPIESAAERAAVDALAADAKAVPYARWRLVQAGVPSAADALIADLRAADVMCRARAAYALERLPQVDSGRALNDALACEPRDSPARIPIAAAVGGDAARALLDDAAPAARYAGATALAEHGDVAERDRARLERLLAEDADADVRVAAAFALGRLDAQATTRPINTREP